MRAQLRVRPAEIQQAPVSAWCSWWNSAKHELGCDQPAVIQHQSTYLHVFRQTIRISAALTVFTNKGQPCLAAEQRLLAALCRQLLQSGCHDVRASVRGTNVRDDHQCCIAAIVSMDGTCCELHWVATLVRAQQGTNTAALPPRSS